MYQSANDATHLQAPSWLATGRLGWSGRYFAVLNRESENGLSLLTRGLENDRSTSSSSSRLYSVAARMALSLSAWRTSGCLRPRLILSRVQARLTKSAAMVGSSRSATSHTTTLRLQTSITRSKYSDIPCTVVGRKAMSQLHTLFGPAALRRGTGRGSCGGRARPRR